MRLRSPRSTLFPYTTLFRSEILDNITLFWVTNTAVSASRLYWEYKGGYWDAKGVNIPVAVSVFPGEQYEAPRRSEEHTSELQSLAYLVCRLLLEKKKHFNTL